MALVEVRNISFKYPNGYVAVDDVSFSIERGENIAIVGQNGAGKTTTVKMLNGLTRPFTGDVLIDGESTQRYTTAQIARRVGYVFQNPDDQIFNSTVYNEMAYGLKRNKVPADERDRRIKDAAALCGISEYLNTNPYNLPLSVRKFVTIASVIASNCDVMVFDEPTAGQDLDGLSCLAKINRELINRKKAIVTITHDMEFVAENYPRVIVMCKKKIIADGATEKIFAQKDIMEKAMLKQPAIIELATEIGMDSAVLDVNKIADYIKQKNREE